MAKLVNLKIDGITVTVPEGTPVVDAAKKIGIDIPVFCYHPKMEPVGMCRQCLVELGRPMIDHATGKAVLEADGSPKVQFMPKLETACTNTASEGMVILTATEKVKAAQKEVLELLLTSHPLDCPVCDKGGECPLQNLTMAHGPNDSRFLYDDKQHLDKRVPLGDLIFLDRERCIQCARCIRFQDDIAGEPVLAFHERGRRTDVVTFSEPGFDSIFSGNTTDICPVGALTTADFRFGARPWELNNAASVCSQCAVGCNITFNVRREAGSGGGYVIKRVLPRQNEQVNEIWMCDKGRFAGYHYTESETRLTDSELDSTLSRAADELTAAKADGVVLAGGRLSNEDLFNLKQLAAALGAQTYFYTGMGGGEYTTAYGLTEGSNLGALGDPQSAGARGDTILVVASDLYNEAPIWHLRVKAAAKRGATVIVAAGRATRLDEFATSVVRYSYGEEVDAVKKLASNEAIANAANLVVFFGSDGLGVNETSALAAACSQLVNGRTGKPNNGLVGVWPTPNAQGAWELGFRPAVDPSTSSGQALATALKGKTVYVVAADPAGDDPQLAEALKSAKIVIAQDVLETETTRLASIVLPAAAYTEREGTYTSAERRVQRFNPAVPARLDAMADYAIVAAIAKKCGVALEGHSPLLVMNQIAAGEPAFAGISYARLAEVTEQWPMVGNGDLYYGGTSYKNTQGLGAHLALSSAPTPATTTLTPSPSPKGRGELLAVPVTKLYDAGATVSPAKLLESHVGPAGVVLNPATAGKLGVDNGEKATVSLNNFEAEVQVHLDESLADGVVLVYRSFGIPIFDPTAVTLTVAEKA
jgi:NADH-quinone oxidoreductase subunit G